MKAYDSIAKKKKERKKLGARRRREERDSTVCTYAALRYDANEKCPLGDTHPSSSSSSPYRQRRARTHRGEGPASSQPSRDGIAGLMATPPCLTGDDRRTMEDRAGEDRAPSPTPSHSFASRCCKLWRPFRSACTTAADADDRLTWLSRSRCARQAHGVHTYCRTVPTRLSLVFDRFSPSRSPQRPRPTPVRRRRTTTNFSDTATLVARGDRGSSPTMLYQEQKMWYSYHPAMPGLHRLKDADAYERRSSLFFCTSTLSPPHPPTRRRVTALPKLSAI